MGNKKSRGTSPYEDGFDVSKAAYERRRRLRLERQVNNDLNSENFLEKVAESAAEKLKSQNDTKLQNRSKVTDAILAALSSQMGTNPFWKFWRQLKRGKEIENADNATHDFADKASDVAVTGIAGFMIFLTKKISMICNPVLWVINLIASRCGLGRNLFMMGEIHLKQGNYFGFGMRERYALIFSAFVTIYLYLLVWRVFKVMVRLFKRVINVF